jgi:hypothetical protein
MTGSKNESFPDFIFNTESLFMSDKHESMIGIMKLYELRREETMRDARRWYADFSPETFKDNVDTVTGENDPYFRMFTTHWDTAAAFVNHDTIDEQLFNEVNVEHILAFAKVEPFIAELRELDKNTEQTKPVLNEHK